MVDDLRFLQHRTIYSRIGDLVAWLSLALSVAALLATRQDAATITVSAVERSLSTFASAVG